MNYQAGTRLHVPPTGHKCPLIKHNFFFSNLLEQSLCCLSDPNLYLKAQQFGKVLVDSTVFNRMCWSYCIRMFFFFCLPFTLFLSKTVAGLRNFASDAKSFESLLTKYKTHCTHLTMHSHRVVRDCLYVILVYYFCDFFFVSLIQNFSV